jgi:hypothetical protein
MKDITILFIILMASTGLIAQTAIAPAVGDGTEGNPYQIANLQNLYWIAASNTVVLNPNQTARWSSHYIQTADIDASATSSWFGGQGWSPIGTSWNNYFSGSYKGQDHTIDGLFINRPDGGVIGFFGYIVDAQIRALGLTNVDILGYSGIGGIAGVCNNSMIDSCYVTGSISGDPTSPWSEVIGGLLGQAYNSTVNNCYSMVNVNIGAYVNGK